jgi:hypothetical protein
MSMKGVKLYGVDIVSGGDTLELLACVDKGGARTELAHVFEHDAVVGGIESAIEVCVHDVDVFVIYFFVLHLSKLRER